MFLWEKDGLTTDSLWTKYGLTNNRIKAIYLWLYLLKLPECLCFLAAGIP